MGDSGSMLIGLVLSASALTLTGQFVDADHRRQQPVRDRAPGAAADLAADGADGRPGPRRRTADAGRPVADEADKQHLHHRLLEIGHSQRRAVLIMWMWAFTLAAGLVIVSLFDEAWVWWSLGSMLGLRSR